MEPSILFKKHLDHEIGHHVGYASYKSDLLQHLFAGRFKFSIDNEYESFDPMLRINPVISWASVIVKKQISLVSMNRLLENNH